jgi:hypothetical protein
LTRAFASCRLDCGGIARFGHLDMRAQAEVLSALRPDTPTRVFKWNGSPWCTFQAAAREIFTG